MENFKKEVISYLTKTANHTFQKDVNGVKSYFKVFVTEEGKVKYMECSTSGQYRIYNIDIDYYVKVYQGNAKCVISNILFLNKKMKAIKQNKYVTAEIEEIIKNWLFE